MKIEKDIYEASRRPYYVYAPDYIRVSAGIKVMHLLCHYLNKAGEEAYVSTKETDTRLRTPLLTEEILARHKAAGVEPIAIYPEVVHGNPFHAKSIVRYILNHPGLLSGPKDFDASDMLVFYTSEYAITFDIETPMLMFIPTIDTSIFNNKNNPFDQNRKGRLIYPGRYIAAKEQHPELFDGATVITYSWPQDHKELSELLRKSEVLYCFANSAILSESLLCGCPVVLKESPYSQRPSGLDGSNISLLAPGVTGSDLPQDIAAAKSETPKYTVLYQSHQDDFQEQLLNFIAASQNIPLHDKSETLPADEQALIRQGIHAYSRNDIDAATARFSEAIANFPANSLPYVYLALISAKSGLREEADNFVRFALSLDPDRHDYVAALGEEYLKNKDHERALDYLQAAVDNRPDLFMAYPALAEAMRLSGRQAEAIRLLTNASLVASDAQEQILDLLLEWHTARGDITTLAEICQRNQDKPTYLAIGIMLQIRTGAPGESVRDATEQYRHLYLPAPSRAPLPDANARCSPLTIAFLVSDFRREQFSGRLEALLQHLPPERFITVVVSNDPQAALGDTAQRCSLISDHWLNVSGMNDTEALQSMSDLAVQVLVDLDGLGIKQRLSLLYAANLPLRLSWSDTSLVQAPGILPLLGIALRETSVQLDESGDVLCLPEVGETYDFPPIDIETGEREKALTFGCLTAAIHFSQDAWKLFAKLLAQTPDSKLRINLADLGPSAEDFIGSFFQAQDVDLQRLEFIHASDVAALCAAWNTVDVGLAPLHGPGDMALPTGLWMDTPYIAMRGDAIWSRRPGALLQATALHELLANSEDAYLAIATDLSRTKLARYRGLRQKLHALQSGQPLRFIQAFADVVEQRYHRAH